MPAQPCSVHAELGAAAKPAANRLPPPAAEEPPRPAGLGGLLTAARRIGSREQLARSLQDASCFFLVPEGLGRELRGRGLAAWARESVLQPLAELQAPPGTVRVGGAWGPRFAGLLPMGSGLEPLPILEASASVAAICRFEWLTLSPLLPSCRTYPSQVVVATLDGRRCSALLPSSSSLHAVQCEAQRQAGLPPDQQRLLVLELRPLSRRQRWALALLRLLLGLLLWAAGWAVAGARWLLGLPPPDGPVQLQLTTDGGREVTLTVSPDTTLAHLQQLISEQHPGERLLDLRQLDVSPANSRRGSSPERGGGGGGSGA